MQQVALWCVCGIVWGSECAAGGFVVCVGQFGGVSVQQVDLWWVWDSLGTECAAGGFVVCVCVCFIVSRGN